MAHGTTARLLLLSLLVALGCDSGAGGLVASDAVADLGLDAGGELSDVGGPDLVGEVFDAVGPDGGVDAGAPDLGPVWPAPCAGDRDCPERFPGQGPCERASCDQRRGLCVAATAGDGTACEPDDACVVSGLCVQGECLGRPRDCDDGEYCTRDRCEPGVGCVHTPRVAPCDDGDPCTEGDTCARGLCQPGPNRCPCELDADCAVHEDGDPCTGELRCTGEGCRIDPESVVHCAPPAPGACGWERCDPATGACRAWRLPDGHPCDDQDACTVLDLCVDGLCQGGLSLDCDDGNPCTEERCHPQAGCLSGTASRPCSDGDGCTQGDRCVAGQCLPGGINACLEATCLPARGLSCGQEERGTRAGAEATNVVVEYDCGGEIFTALDGPELSYAFVAPYDGRATLRALALPPDAALFVLEATGRGCDPRGCRGAATPARDFPMTAGRSYYIVVDAPEGVAPDFTLRLDCRPERERVCDDGVDDDGDGATDCADDDCVEDDACVPRALGPVHRLTCGAGARVGAHTGGAGASDLRSVYGCELGAELLSGPELVYSLRAPVAGDYELRLERPSAPLALIALRPASEGGACLGRSPEGLRLPLVAGEEILLVVDGPDPAGASFELALRCPEARETSCDDGLDNDGDGATDCADEDCRLAPACDPTFCPPFAGALSCGDHVQASTESLVAVSTRVDYPCSLFPFTGPEMLFPIQAPAGALVVVRLEAADEDLDVFLLSAPEGQGCGAERCVSQGDEVARFQARPGERLYALVDGYGGAASSFALSVQCYSGREEICDDGEDDDGDGRTDCRDLDCLGSPACPECSPAHVAVLGCDEPYRISTLAPAATDRVTRYGCNDNDYSGPERVFALDVPFSGTVTFWLEDRSAALDLLLLEAVDGACSPAHCLSYSPYRVRRTLTGGKRYFVVLDGYEGAAGEATLTLDCESW